MLSQRLWRLLCLLVWLLAGTGTAAAQPHDATFWRAIARDGFAPPPGADVPALAGELVDLLASPDPELRDDVAYSTLANWIFRRKILDPAALAPITDRLLTNLTWRVGERDTDSVFRRSFSALVLTSVAARDNADPFLDASDWHRIEQAALAYLLAEQDVRGYDADKGWMHSAAHTADLLKFLGRSRNLDLPGQARFLAVIGQKLTTVAVVFTHGEDERLARALLSLVNRPDFDRGEFAAWLTRTKPTVSPRPLVAELRAIQNWKNTLAKLEVILSSDLQPSNEVASARTSLRAALKELF